MSSPAAAGLLTVLLPTGGYIGYRNKKSVISLVAGSVSGAMMALSLFFLLQNPQDKIGNRIAGVTSLILTIVMGLRYYKGGKMAPLITSVLTGVSFIVAFGPNCF